ncbi:MAG: fibronectin type III domain-containing protein [Bacteroidota bacterium]
MQGSSFSFSLRMVFMLMGILFIAQLNAQCFEPDASVWQNTWASCTPRANPKAAYGVSHWIQYDFGQVKRLSRSWVWNTNDPAALDQGFQEVHVDYSMDGDNWTYWGDITFAQGTGEAVYGGFPGPNLEGITAQYVLLTAVSNYGNPGCYGLAEVKFNLLPYPEGASADGTYENCTAITEATAEIVGQTEVLLSWEPNGVTEDYLVEYRLLGASTWLQAEDEFSESFLENLVALETYEYRITSMCFSEFSEPVMGTFTLTEAAICATLEETETILGELGAATAFLYWPLEADVLTNLEVTLTPEEGSMAEAITLQLSEPAVLLEALLPNTSYELVLSWRCGGERYELDEFVFTTLEEDSGLCSAVEEVELESIDLTTASFVWTPGNDVEEYLISYKLEEEEDWITLTTQSPAVTLDNLEPEMLYQIVVGVQCGDNILYSFPFYFFTEPLTSTGSPTQVQRTVNTFPNPTRSLLAVEYISNVGEAISYELISPLGQVVETGRWEHPGGKQQYQLDLARQADGIYLLRLAVDERRPVATRKVVKIGGRR